jgi:hypothetical protein
MIRIVTNKRRTGKGIPAYILIEFNASDRQGSSITYVEVKWGGFIKRMSQKPMNSIERPISNSEMFQGYLFALLNNDFNKETEHVFIDDITKIFKPNSGEIEECFEYLEYLMKSRNIHFTLFVPSKKLADLMK